MINVLNVSSVNHNLFGRVHISAWSMPYIFIADGVINLSADRLLTLSTMKPYSPRYHINYYRQCNNYAASLKT